MGMLDEEVVGQFSFWVTHYLLADDPKGLNEALDQLTQMFDGLSNVEPDYHTVAFVAYSDVLVRKRVALVGLFHDRNYGFYAKELSKLDALQLALNYSIHQAFQKKTERSVEDFKAILRLRLKEALPELMK